MTDKALTVAARELYELQAALKSHLDTAKQEEAQLRSEIRNRELVLSMSESGLDGDRIALARTIVRATDYSRGGADRDSCRRDAIKQLSTGKPIRVHYGDLWRVYFGTKNYDRWQGQRSDHDYGYGPKHGSVCFKIGVTEDARKRDQSDLAPQEVEAAIYFLVNLERIQKAEKNAAEKAEAA